jgi:hemerythrin
VGLLIWNDAMRVNIPPLDEQHKRLFAIVNQLHDAMVQGQANQAMQPALAALADYARVHFASEEAYLKDIKHPGLPTQIIEHQSFVAKLADLQIRLKQGQYRVNLDMMNFLRDWLKNHIMIEDLKYAPKA